MEDWVRWVIGVLGGIFTVRFGWLYHLYNGLDKRVAVLENRPHIDPISYTTEMTKVVAAIARLTEKIAENIQSRQEQYDRLNSAHMVLLEKMEALTDEVDVLISKFEEYEREHANVRSQPPQRSV